VGAPHRSTHVREIRDTLQRVEVCSSYFNLVCVLISSSVQSMRINHYIEINNVTCTALTNRVGLGDVSRLVSRPVFF
jgi:hypothetical protein